MKVTRVSETNVAVDRNVRRRWEWLADRAWQRGGLNVLDAELVDDYIAEFDASFRPTWWGAHKCRQLGADLSRMAKLGYLRRHTTGLGSNWQPGFPRWVWSYHPGKYADVLSPKQRA